METMDLLQKVYELKDLILDCKEYQLTKQKEEEMMSDEKFIMLSNAFMNAQNDYNEAIRLGLDDKEKKQRLIETKEALYSYDKVKAYLDCYHELNNMLKDVSNKIEEIIKWEL